MTDHEIIKIMGWANKDGKHDARLLRRARDLVEAARREREACAAVAADMGLAFERSESGLYANEAAYRVEHAIRARGEKGGAKC